jgi:hypothetical protein
VDNGSTKSTTDTLTLDTVVNYQIRKLLFNIIYRVKEEDQSGRPSGLQQLYYVKVSRPF